MDESEFQDEFFGKVGEPVPAVDAQDLKTVWEQAKDSMAQQKATGLAVYEAMCAPGANVRAVSYRAMLLALLLHVGMKVSEAIQKATDPEELAELRQLEKWFVSPPTDAVFSAMSKVSLTWPALGPFSGLPFDVSEFGRLCESA